MPNENEIDLKAGDSVAPETGQTETTEVKEEAPAETKVEETPIEETPIEETEETEDVDSLKERLKKAEEEKENYKKGMFKYKDLSLKKKEEKEEEVVEEYPDWDETSKKFQKQTISQAEKIAEAKAQAIVESYNEKTAIAQFIEKNPEFSEKWNEIVANYTPTHGKDTPQNILKDLNRALLLTRYDNGEIETIVADAEKKGRNKGRAEVELADKTTISKTTSKTTKERNSLSSSAIKMAQKMRVDPQKMAEEDLSIPAEINF